jgi:hypothetical protein
MASLQTAHKQPKTFKPSIATANDLRSGAVVFRHADGSWSPDVARAEVADTREAADTLLARARADHEACIVVEPVLIPVVRQAGQLRPAELRELIRASGPTAETATFATGAR